MSISSMTNLALDRKVPSEQGDGTPELALDRAADANREEASDEGTVTKALDVVMAYIPTEILTLYVAVTAVLHDGSDSGATTDPGRTLFWIFLVATPVVVWTIYAGKFRPIQKRLPLKISEWPRWEMVAAIIAFAAWAFALPGGPFEVARGLAGIGVLVVSVVLGLAALVFKPLPAS